MKEMNRTYAVILSLVFLTWISVPLTWQVLKRTKSDGISRWENRKLHKRPAFRLSGASTYATDYEKYYNDHFFLRYELIHLNTLVVYYYLFHRSPVPDEVVFGDQGWLFPAGRERGIYEGRYNITDFWVQAIVKELQDRSAEYRKKGIKFYVAVVPMKCEIYPEHLPSYFTRRTEPVFTDRIRTMLAKDTLCHLIDLKNAMLEGKKEGEVYYRTDNHWNGLGAWYAYRTITERIRQDFPAIRPLKKEEILFSKIRAWPGNLATLAGLHQYIREDIFVPAVKNPRSHEVSPFGYRPPPGFSYPNDFEVVRVTPDYSLPRIVVIRDSFFKPIIGLISENFRRTTCIFDAWKYAPNRMIINNEKPDIVLMEIFAPNLEFIEPGN